MSSMWHHSRTFLRRATLVGIILAFAGTAYAAGSFDGTYKGTQTMIKYDNGGRCWFPHDVAIIVHNNHFARGFLPYIVEELSVDIANNGTLFSQGAGHMFDIAPPQMVITITGKITGGDLEADMGSQFCAVHLSLKKS